MSKKIIFCVLILGLFSLRVNAQTYGPAPYPPPAPYPYPYYQPPPNVYTGFHLGIIAGAGFLVQQGGFAHNPSQVSANLEYGYNFGPYDLIGRIGYSPLFGTGGSVPIDFETNVNPPSRFDLFNVDFGLRYNPFPARFSPYFVMLFGFYNSNTGTSGVFDSQNGFHQVTGIGLQYHITNHHMIGLELSAQSFFNNEANIVSIVISPSYTLTF